MINRDLLTDFLLKLNSLGAKKGNHFGLRGEVKEAINAFFDDKSLKAIYINEANNVLVPDVFVMPIYNKSFGGGYLLDPYLGNNCPYGYTLEIKKSAFDTYKAEELGAIIIHHILQNVMSGCAKSRFLGAFTAAMEKYNDPALLEFDPEDMSELCYLGYIDICLRPFNVPVSFGDTIGTDEVLTSIGLADAFDSALSKMRAVDHRSVETPEEYIDHEVMKDHETIKNIFAEYKDKTLPRYYDVVMNGIPLLTLKRLQSSEPHSSVLGFVSCDNTHCKRRFKDCEGSKAPMSESILKPKTEVELRFQLDKIITEMRYMENEAERSAVLYKLKCLQLKLLKTKKLLESEMKRGSHDSNNIAGKIEYVDKMMEEVDSYREETVKKPVTPKHYGVFVQYPAGYEY